MNQGIMGIMGSASLIVVLVKPRISCYQEIEAVKGA